ncbi:MAG: penicillin-binding transpeptidase domain-containing protein [Clostridia bacterium]
MPTELHIRKRVFILLMLLVILYCLLAARITFLTTVESSALTSRGVAQWTREGTVYARRGNIMDTNGQALVVSATAYIVSVDPRKVSNVSLFAQTICPILELTEELVAQKLADKSLASVTLKRQVPRAVADELRLLQTSENRAVAKELSALLFDEDVRRAYPRGVFLAQTLGLCNVDSVGQSGLEKQYDTLLRGKEGISLRSVDGKAQPIYDSENLYIEPQDGNAIKLTIDASIQEICEKAMRECYEVNKAQGVYAIAMDVYTGAILAMCAKPDYDPNTPPRDQPDALQSLMRIRLISDAYEPGSTFKVITAAAAIDAGVTTPEDHFYCSAKIKVDGDTIRCWGSPHKAQTMAEGLQNSCNPVFVELALRLGTERMYQYLHAFGLGKKMNVDLPGEGSGILIPVKSVKNVDLARVGFGQSIALTPLQMITSACAVVNGGRLMQPYLLKEAISPNGTVLYRSLPKVVSTPITEETSATMRALLEKVVSVGGAKNAKIDGYQIGGKTGTAQVYKEGRIVRDVHIGSFFGFAPANDPQIALLVIVDEADTPVDYGGTTAAPYARQIFADVLPYLGCQPAYEDGRSEVSVANAVGLPLWEARKVIADQGFRVIDDGAGDVVTAQMPSAGGMLISGGQVMLYTYADQLPEAETLICVPEVEGLSIAQAAAMLRTRRLETEIEGSGFAVKQEPAAGEFVSPNSVVKVTFVMPSHDTDAKSSF